MFNIFTKRMNMNPQVDLFIEKSPNWQDELQLLRTIVLDCELTEEFKWKCPIYSYRKANIIGINGFKDSCVFSFFKGSLLSDGAGVLLKPGENSQAARYIKFKSTAEILALETTLKAYIYEAIEVEKAGLKVNTVKPEDLALPDELQQKMNDDLAFKSAFESLTPGRQKAYIYHFSEPKQSTTRTARIEKYLPRILNGFGLTDCICGLSRKKPGCDGSHKHLQK